MNGWWSKGNEGTTSLAESRPGETTGVALKKIIDTKGEAQNKLAVAGVEETGS